jgi:hypothetical protein
MQNGALWMHIPHRIKIVFGPDGAIMAIHSHCSCWHGRYSYGRCSPYQKPFDAYRWLGKPSAAAHRT